MKKIILTPLLLTTALLAVSVSSVAQTQYYPSKGILEYEANGEPVNPVDPEKPTDPVKPVDPTDPDGPDEGTDGPLSINYASSINFGRNKISREDAIYYADAQTFKDENMDLRTANYVQVSDNRGTAGGWKLMVSQMGQFRSTEAKEYKELKGVQMVFDSPEAVSISDDEEIVPSVDKITLDPEGASSLVMLAKTGQGLGTWLSVFGEAEEIDQEGEAVAKNKAVYLEVPGKTPKEAAEYRTKLVWTLTDVPGN